MNWKSRIERLKDAKTRRKHLENNVSMVLPIQIRALRKQRGLSQTELATKMGKSRSNEAISRLERPYKSFTIKTLLDLAEHLDVALLVKFVPWSRFFDEFEDLSEDNLKAPSFSEERDSLMAVDGDVPTLSNLILGNIEHSDSSNLGIFKCTVVETDYEYAIRA